MPPSARLEPWSSRPRVASPGGRRGNLLVMGNTVTSALMKAVAVVVLAVAAWLLLKLVLHVVAAVAWIVAAVLAVIAVLWAISTLRS
jgi:hypothetical protein